MKHGYAIIGFALGLVLGIFLGLILFSGCSTEEKQSKQGEPITEGLEGIVFEGKTMPIGESFTLEFPPTTEKAEIRLLGIIDKKTIEVEYPDSVVGGIEHPGLCTKREGKKYETEISSGQCIHTNSCDGGVKGCFSFQKENSFLKVTYTTEQFGGLPLP